MLKPECEHEMTPMPNPTQEEIDSNLFSSIWKVIKDWDINAPSHYSGYCGANGSHVKLIMDAINNTEPDPEPQTYEYVSPFIDGVAVVAKSDQEQFLIDESGENVFGKVFKQMTMFMNGVGQVATEAGAFHISRENANPLYYPHTFKDVEPFVFEETAIVTGHDEHMYIIDREGTVLTEGYYNIHIKNGYYIATHLDTMQDHILNSSGVKIGDDDYMRINPFVEGVAPVKRSKDSKWELIDDSGSVILGETFNNLCGFSGKYIHGSVNDNWGVYDLTGKLIFSADKKDDFTFLSTDRAIVCDSKDMKRILDLSTGKILHSYSELNDDYWLDGDVLSYTSASDDTDVHINHDGEKIYPQTFRSVGFFGDNEYTCAQRMECDIKGDPEWIIINKQGEILPDKIHYTLDDDLIKGDGTIIQSGEDLDRIDCGGINNDIFYGRRNEKYFIINSDGEDSPYEYDHLSFTDKSDIGVARIGDSFFHVDRTGKLLY